MFLTEEEALKKVCHMKFAMPEPPVNRMGGGSSSTPFLCIGSACMAWRETVATTGDAIETCTNEGAPEYRRGHRWRLGSDKGKSIWGLFKTLGYCGAAGPVDERTGR